MVVWRRKPRDKVLIHSDRGSQFTRIDWASFLKQHNLGHSMSRRCNCHDNAVAESFFNLLNRKRFRRKIYKTRDEARQNVFDYIEMFYDPKRKHVRNGMLPPIEFETQQKLNSRSVVRVSLADGTFRRSNDFSDGQKCDNVQNLKQSILQSKVRNQFLTASTNHKFSLNQKVPKIYCLTKSK